MGSSERNQPETPDSPDRPGHGDAQVPELLLLLFGENAAAAWAAAGERMQRWAAMFADWLRMRTESYRRQVAVRDRTAWCQFLGLVNKTPWEVDAQDVQAYVEHLLEKGISPGTISNRLSSLSVFYDYVQAQEQGMGDVAKTVGQAGFNPVKEIERPKANPSQQIRCLNAEEARALLGAIDREWSLLGKRDYALFLMHLLTGLPSGEIRKLQRRDLRVGSQGTQVQRRIGADKVWVSLPDEPWEAILEYLDAAGRWEAMGADDYVFSPLKKPLLEVPSGLAQDWAGERPITVSLCHGLLQKYARWAGLGGEKLSMHTLRHTAAMLRVQAGDDPGAIQAFLGYTEKGSTTRYLKQLADIPQPPPGDPPQPTRDLSKPPRHGPGGAKPGEQRNMKHGYYAERLPDAEVQAVLAEGIVGMQEEIKGLRTLSRALREKQKKVHTKKELAQLSEAYMQAADRQRVMIMTEGNLGGSGDQDGYNEAVLTMLDDFAVSMGEEPFSEEVRQMAAGSDSEMEVGALRLTEEIAIARLVLRNTYLLALEAETVQERLHYTDLYGRSCIQLARMLKFEGAVQDQLGDFLRKEIEAAILEVNAEWGLDLGGPGK